VIRSITKCVQDDTAKYGLDKVNLANFSGETISIKDLLKESINTNTEILKSKAVKAVK
jgi:hypothetical protein